MAVAADALRQPGLVLDRYRPLQPLGTGGSGSVWLAQDEETGAQVALKIVAREGKAGPRAEREAAAAARLRHERCQRAQAFATDEGHVYIAYEYVPGRTLREALRRRELKATAVVEAAAQVLDALAYAHAQGIVHRDVKPANVLLADGDGVSVRLLDFGLAQLADGEALTAPGDVPGTLAYIAPERLRGENGSPASDVWSVGVILWEALGGKHPFADGSLVETARRIAAGAPSLGSVRPDVPERLSRAIERALSSDPARRPSAATLARVLRQAVRPVPPRPAKRPARPWDLDLSRLAHIARQRPALHRVAPPLLAGLYAALGATMLPFYPSGWPVALAVACAALTLAIPRLGLAAALLVPLFPLGNLSAGLAFVYCAAALVWYALFAGDARAGTAPAAGPVLAAVGALGLLPLAVVGVNRAVRRFALGTAGAAAAGIAASIRHATLPLTGAAPPPSLHLHGTSHPLQTAAVLWRAAAAEPAFVVKALGIGAVCAALPLLRRRGTPAAFAPGAALMALALLPKPAVAAIPLALAGIVTSGALVLEQRLPTR
jgi:eukaryotic-like serine/threonine-protein kinase